MKRLSLPKEEIVLAYKSGKSSASIAAKYSCSKGTILNILKENEVRRRPPGTMRIKISDEKLRKLYLSNKMSTWKIAKIFNYGRSTIHRHTVRLGINRDIATAHMIYHRAPFSGDLKEKAYLEGFAIGDLRVRKVGRLSKTIKIDCGSTTVEQVDLFKKLFSKYGRVWISNLTAKKIQMEAFLDDSFSFLLKAKENYNWVFDKQRYFVRFFAGFIDAEGSFHIRNRPTFSLGNYDIRILNEIRQALLRFGFTNVHIYADKRKGTFSTSGYVYQDNYKSLVITKKSELLRLINLVEGEIRHKNRKRQIILVKKWFKKEVS